MIFAVLELNSGGSRISERGGPRTRRRRRRDSRAVGARIDGAEGAEVERRRREDRGAEGGGEGCPPPHWGRGLGRGLCPVPRKFLIFHL